MFRLGIGLTALTVAIILGGCDKPSSGDNSETTSEAGITATPPSPATVAPFVKVSPTVLNSQQVKFVVETNLPTPITVMAGLGLAGQAPDDVFVGTDNERVVLTGPQTEFIIQATDLDGATLPSGDYNAEVGFYPRWGAKNGNPDAASYPKTEGSTLVTLGGSGVPAAKVVARKEMQRWVMSNINMNSPWNKASYESRLGPSVKGPSTMSHLHDAYYFRDADVTLLVNRLKNEVTVWRLGDKTE